MTMDRTLKSHGSLRGMRSVLTRDERIARMIEEGKFDPEKDDPFGLPKMRVRHSKAGSKSRKEEAPTVEAAGGAEGAPAAGEAAAEGKTPAGQKKK
jgi:small basic protein (TIGR04137 family)